MIIINKSAIDNIIKNIQKVQNLLRFKINYLFLQYSLNWIRKRAIELLDQRTNGYKSSNARQWEIINNGYSAKLINQDPNSASIEFGIGIKGQNEINENAQNDPRIIALKNGYKYNQKSDYKDDNGYWTFRLDDGTFLTINGYGGKSFLYDSLVEFIQKNMYYACYKKAFDEVMGGIKFNG